MFVVEDDLGLMASAAGTGLSALSPLLLGSVMGFPYLVERLCRAVPTARFAETPYHKPRSFQVSVRAWRMEAGNRAGSSHAFLSASQSANLSTLSSCPLWPSCPQPLGSWVSKIDFFASGDNRCSGIARMSHASAAPILQSLYSV